MNTGMIVVYAITARTKLLRANDRFHVDLQAHGVLARDGRRHIRRERHLRCRTMQE